MGVIALGAGAALAAGGGYLNARAAGKKKKALRKLAQTPGLDFGAITGEYLDEVNTYLPRQLDASRRITEGQDAILQASLERNIPGYRGLLEQRSQVVGDALSGKLGKDTLAQIDRATAGRNVDRFGGFGGTFEDRQRAANIGSNSWAMQQWGTGALPGVISSTPRANPYDVSNFFGANPTTRAQFRANERTQRMGLEGQAINVPTSEAIAGQAMGQFGSTLMGAGLGGIMDNGGFSGMFSQNTPGATGTGVSSAQMGAMNREYQMGWDPYRMDFNNNDYLTGVDPRFTA